MPTKAEIIAQLQREILPLQGYKPLVSQIQQDAGLAIFGRAFPQGVFPTGAIHEFICPVPEDEAATGGFIAGLLSSLLPEKGSSIWLTRSHRIFPPALSYYGLAPERIIFIHLTKEKDLLWATEEALKCGAATAVISEIPALSFNVSRRFQLAVESSSVTGFLMRNNSRTMNTTASMSKWYVRSLPSQALDELPGVGFPRWQVNLEKVRNGKPCSWEIEWRKGRFFDVAESTHMIPSIHRKTG